MKNNLIIKISLFFLAVCFFCSGSLVYADLNVNFIINDGSVLLFNGSALLPPAGDVSISDIDGNLHPLNALSALAVLHQIDESNDSFSISNLKYYDSFGSFYLKCITPQNAAEDCDNWMYLVNGVAPSAGLDNVILSGGETVALYFGSPYQAPSNSENVPVGSGPLVTDYNPPVSSITITNSGIPAPAVTTPLPIISAPIVSVVSVNETKSNTIVESKKADNSSDYKIAKTPSKIVKKISKLNLTEKNITASVITAVNAPIKVETPKPVEKIGWFRRFLNTIFGF